MIRLILKFNETKVGYYERIIDALLLSEGAFVTLEMGDVEKTLSWSNEGFEVRNAEGLFIKLTS